MIALSLVNVFDNVMLMYLNLTILSRVVAKNVGVPFLRYTVYITQYSTAIPKSQLQNGRLTVLSLA